MLTHSEQMDQIASALADAQADLGIVIKQNQNDAFGSRYADLTKVWEAFQRVGPRHGLSIVQMPGHFDAAARTMSMSVRLMHNSGQWLGGDMSMPLSRADAHAYGSACTYARRYSLAALIGICPYDDDGNEASGVQVGAPPYQLNKQWSSVRSGQAKLQAVSRSRAAGLSSRNRDEEEGTDTAVSSTVPADPQGLHDLRKLVAKAGADEDALCAHYRVSELDELSPRDAARARRALLRKIEDQQEEVKS